MKTLKPIGTYYNTAKDAREAVHDKFRDVDTNSTIYQSSVTTPYRIEYRPGRFIYIR